MISKSDLLKVVQDALAKGYCVYAPVRRETEVLIKRVTDSGRIELDHVLTVNTLKDVLLPRCEILAGLDLEGHQVKAVTDPDEKVLVFGSRPCDAAGMDILDPILIGEVRDTRYAGRRQRTVIMTVGCSRCDDACFCTSMGYGPHDATGSDVLVLPRDGGFILRAITDKGKQFVAEIGAQESDDVGADRPPVPERGVNTDGLKLWLDSNFDNARWQHVSENCISCGACYYLCPTCHCYDIVDEAGISRGERLRIWDCCSFAGFTRMASHQPRVGRHARYRQRIMHKFKYTVDNVDRVACVGDGRCIRHCPTGVDICEILEALPKEG
jgi:ferredoxin